MKNIGHHATAGHRHTVARRVGAADNQPIKAGKIPNRIRPRRARYVDSVAVGAGRTPNISVGGAEDSAAVGNNHIIAAAGQGGNVEGYIGQNAAPAYL